MANSISRVNALRELVEWGEASESLAERAGIFSATSFLLSEICKHQHQRSYIQEKAYKFRAHIGAILGFEPDREMSLEHHKKAARIELDSLESALSSEACVR